MVVDLAQHEIFLAKVGISKLNHCLLGMFCMLLMSSDFFFKINVFKNPFSNTFRVSNSLDQDQVRHSVGPNPSPICFQRSSADCTSRQRVMVSTLVYGKYNTVTHLNSVAANFDAF